MDAWRTAITSSSNGELRVRRGYDVTALMTGRTFTDLIALLFKGELPSTAERTLLDAVLVGMAAPGSGAPSCAAARLAASGNRASLSAAVGAGILTIGDEHGGAGSNCMELIAAGLALAAREGLSLDDAAGRLVDEARSANRRLPGFGHRVHTHDPRTPVLFEMARAHGVAGDGVRFTEALERAIAARVRPLTINIDGALAALLHDLGQQDLPAGRPAQALRPLHRAGVARRPRRRPEGIRHRRAGLRPRGFVRSAHRPDRARAGAAAPRPPRSLLPRGRARRRRGHRAAERRLRAGLAPPRSDRPAARLAGRGHGRTQHARRCCRTATAATAPPWVRSAAASVTRSCTRSCARRGCASSRRATGPTGPPRTCRHAATRASSSRGARGSRRAGSASPPTWSTARAATCCGRAPTRPARPTPSTRSSASPPRWPTASSPISATARRRGSPTRPTTSRRATSTCRAATTSTSAPKTACSRPSTSSSGRSSKTRSIRWPTAAWPTPTGCSRTTACSGRPMCGPRRRRARPRR